MSELCSTKSYLFRLAFSLPRPTVRRRRREREKKRRKN